jgi:hypothetical protein
MERVAEGEARKQDAPLEPGGRIGAAAVGAWCEPDAGVPVMPHLRPQKTDTGQLAASADSSPNAGLRHE